MRVLLCHTRYRVRGGEDESFAAEGEMLERHGHDVIRFVRDNDSLEAMAPMAKAARTVWNHAIYRELRDLMRRERPDVLHCTNLFPLLSPAPYYAAARANVPVVQSLRNYRLSCLNAFFFRDGKVCESCLGRTVAWPGIVRGCYRESRASSAVVAAMISTHRLVGSWNRRVHQYFAVSQFAKEKLAAAGVPSDRIAVKPNFVHPDPGLGSGRGRYAVFVGRLSPEKGIETLLETWQQHDLPVSLRIVGDGPLSDRVASMAHREPSIEWLGRRPASEVLDIIGEAEMLIMPSRWFETFGRTIVEAFAKGTPVIASNLGAMAELIDHNRNGLLVSPGQPDELARAVRSMASDDLLRARLRRAARAAFLEHYTEDRNHGLLMDIYRAAMTRAGRTDGTDRERPVASSAESAPGEAVHG